MDVEPPAGSIVPVPAVEDDVNGRKRESTKVAAMAVDGEARPVKMRPQKMHKRGQRTGKQQKRKAKGREGRGCGGAQVDQALKRREQVAEEEGCERVVLARIDPLKAEMFSTHTCYSRLFWRMPTMHWVLLELDPDPSASWLRCVAGRWISATSLRSGLCSAMASAPWMRMKARRRAWRNSKSVEEADGVGRGRA